MIDSLLHLLFAAFVLVVVYILVGTFITGKPLQIIGLILGVVLPGYALRLFKVAVPALAACGLLALSGCMAGTDGKKHFSPVAWTGAHQEQIGETVGLAMGKVVNVAVAGLLNAAVSSQDAHAKADIADTVAYGFRTLPAGVYVNDQDVKNVFAIWAPDKPHWEALGEQVVKQVDKLADPKERTPENIATALNVAAAEMRVMTTTGA